MIHHLQCGDKRIQFQRTPEHTEFDGVHVGEVDAGVAAAVAFFDVFQHFTRSIPVAVAGSPLLQLPLGTAGEAQQLCPVALYEEQHTGNGVVLRVQSVPEGLAGYMDVQPAGARLMG